MSKLDNFISKFRVVRVRSRKLTIIVLVVAIVLSMIALAALHLSMQWLSARTNALRDQAAHLEGENAALQEDIDQVGSMQSIVEIAEKELGLVSPDAVFYETAP